MFFIAEYSNRILLLREFYHNSFSRKAESGCLLVELKKQLPNQIFGIKHRGVTQNSITDNYIN